MQKCPNCNREMSPIFFSVACDYCDGIETVNASFVGYVVWSDKFVIPSRCYVFARQEFAERWKQMRGPDDATIRKVVSTYPFKWRSGVQATSDLEFADTLVEIYADQKFEPGPHRAFFAD